MTAERQKAINEWLDIYCPKCANNNDRGTDFVNCQAECEVQKDIGITCIHYEEAYDLEPQSKTGHWIEHEPFDADRHNCNVCIECSNCHTWFEHDCYTKTEFCPNCGVKMVDEEVEK